MLFVLSFFRHYLIVSLIYGFVPIFFIFQDFAALRKKIETLQSVVTKNTAYSVLDMIRQLLASLVGSLVVPYALLAAIEQLEDVSRDTNHQHPECKRFEASSSKKSRLLKRS